MTWIWHITTKEAWDQAIQHGEYRADSLATEGFMHASTESQLEASANRHFAQAPSILLLKVNCEKLVSPLVWEESSHSATPFPHLYGPLNLDAVASILFWDRSRDGSFRKPTLL